MLEDFKSFVAWAISPLVVALFLLLLAGLLHCRRRWRRWAPVVWGAALLVLLVGSLPVLSYEANRAREFVHDPLDLAADLATDRPVLVVVLGTGFNPDEWLPPNSRVSGTAHARFLEGVRVCRAREDARLLVSVANEEASRSDKEAFLDAMVELVALDPERVALMSEARSTEDEAELAAERRREGEQVVVATSAGHMPRAMTIFAEEGLDPLAAPADFWYPREGSAGDEAWKRWIPSAGGIGGTRRLLYESLASLWQSVKGS